MATYGKQSGKHTARIRLGTYENFKGGFDTKKEAKQWAEQDEALYASKKGSMKGMGPNKTLLAVALRDYAYDRLVQQKGCVQALCRINKYLRAGGLPELRATLRQGGRVFEEDASGQPQTANQKKKPALYILSEVEPEPLFQAPQQAAFARRASDNAGRDAAPQAVRERLARLRVADLKGFHISELLAAMLGYAGATQRQEIAILSSFFEHAKKNWNWPLGDNPMLTVQWPEGDERERVLSKQEAARLAPALANCRNKVFQIFVLLAMETTMRRGELLWTARWCDIDRDEEEGDVLKLADAKKGHREVPLTPFALQLLAELPQGAPHERIFPMTESALSSAWSRVCAAAGIVDLHIHDLRHTGATMFSKLLNGDIFALQKITGIKTLDILRVYVNQTAREVSKRLRVLPAETVAQTLRQGIADAPKPVKRARVAAEPECNAPAGTAVMYDFKAFAAKRACRQA